MTQRDAWWWALLAVILIGVLVHALFPRYEWRTVGERGAAIVVFDRWNGRFQRAEYDEAGKLKTLDVYTPF
jgi:hypothetical protein